jgi:hypothetical protein
MKKLYIAQPSESDFQPPTSNIILKIRLVHNCDRATHKQATFRNLQPNT